MTIYPNTYVLEAQCIVVVTHATSTIPSRTRAWRTRTWIMPPREQSIHTLVMSAYFDAISPTADSNGSDEIRETYTDDQLQRIQEHMAFDPLFHAAAPDDEWFVQQDKRTTRYDDNRTKLLPFESYEREVVYLVSISRSLQTVQQVTNQTYERNASRSRESHRRKYITRPRLDTHATYSWAERRVVHNGSVTKISKAWRSRSTRGP